MTFKSRFALSGFLVLVLMQAGCLRTRAQMKEDKPIYTENAEEYKPVPAQAIEEVAPEGGYVFEELKDELTRLAGRVEDLERAEKARSTQKLPDASVGLTESLGRLEERIAQLEKQLESMPKAEAHMTSAASNEVKKPEEIFQQAKDLFDDGNYQEAEEKFTLYLKVPKIRKQQDALFLKGECLYRLKEYKKAVVEYSKFPEKYPKSAHMPEALYKIALSFDALGMKEDAKGFYQELVEKFPKSQQSVKAKKKLK